MRTTTTLPDHKTVLGALRLANRAPSLHNTQPWHWLVGEYSVHLMADRSRHLPACDPDERDLIIGCGAALHHLRTALASFGWHAEARLLPGTDPDHLASVEMTPREPSEQDIALAMAIPRRHTDHRRLTPWPVPIGHVDLMARYAAEAGGRLVPLTKPSHRRAVTDPDTDPEDGELLVLVTADDDVLSWLRAGEATSAALLAATGLDLATCPLSQPLATGQTRTRIRDEVLHGASHPQIVLRVGWTDAGPLPRSPRRPIEHTVTYLPGTGPRRGER